MGSFLCVFFWKFVFHVKKVWSDRKVNRGCYLCVIIGLDSFCVLEWFLPIRYTIMIFRSDVSGFKRAMLLNIIVCGKQIAFSGIFSNWIQGKFKVELCGLPLTCGRTTFDWSSCGILFYSKTNMRFTSNHIYRIHSTERRFLIHESNDYNLIWNFKVMIE